MILCFPYWMLIIFKPYLFLWISFIYYCSLQVKNLIVFWLIWYILLLCLFKKRNDPYHVFLNSLCLLVTLQNWQNNASNWVAVSLCIFFQLLERHTVNGTALSIEKIRATCGDKNSTECVLSVDVIFEDDETDGEWLFNHDRIIVFFKGIFSL